MALTHAQRTGLEAAILAYLTAEGGRFARTVAAFKEEAQQGGSGSAEDALVVDGSVLEKAWKIFISKEPQVTGLEAAILAYLAAEGGRFARTVAAFKEEAQVLGGGDGGNVVVSGAVLEKAWAHVHHNLKSKGKANQKTFFDAIESGDLAEVQLYVCVGVDVKALRNGSGAWSPLFYAAKHNRMELVQCFLKTGHEIDTGARNGATPLHVAAQEGHVVVVQYLVEQSADKEKASNEGVTPLNIAAQEGHLLVVQYLVEQGADKDKAMNDGSTPLYIAAQNGYLAVVQHLVEQGADKDKAMNDGNTPLMVASSTGHADVAEYLLDQGCDRDRADDEGWTALHWAAQNCHLDIAQVLFRYGAKLDARSNAGETPADVATRRGHLAFADAVRAEEIRRRDHGFKRDRSTIEGTEEHEAAKRPRVEKEQTEEEVDESDDDDDDDDDDDEEA